MVTAVQRVLRGLEEAGYPTGTLGPAHERLPALAGRSGARLVEVLLELDQADLDQLHQALHHHTTGPHPQ
ncbi:hypothetical protein GCM10027447_01950 [Glycomyces halotolerans]